MTETKKSPSIPKVIRKLKVDLLALINRQSTLSLRLRVVFSDAKKTLRPIELYWAAYGGSSAFIKSPYLWTAIVLTMIMTPDWLAIDKEGARVWAQLPLQILPNVLGFSMGGMAIVLAFTGSSIFKVITENGNEHSYFIKMIAAFYHFIIVQTLAITFGLICRTYPNVILSAIGYFLMCYAIMVALATAAQLFNTARIANIASNLTEQQITAASSPSTVAKQGDSEQRSSP